MPRNRVTVGDIDLYDEYGLVLSDDYVIPVAEYRDFSVDLMGDGKLDLSEFSGDLLFQNREMKLPFFVPRSVSQREYESLKSRIACDIHGKRCEITLAVDCVDGSDAPFVHTGRVRAYEFKREGGTLVLDMTVDAEPFKSKGLVTLRAEASGGHVFELPNGRARTQPTVEVGRSSELTHEGVTFTVEAGTWKVPRFWLHGGTNHVTVNTAPDFSAMTWGDYEPETWGDQSGKTWSEMQAGGAAYPSGDEYQAYFQYEWKDL